MITAAELRMVSNLYWNKDADKYIDIELKCREAAANGKKNLKYHWPEIVEAQGRSKLSERQIKILYTLNTQGIKTGFDAETMSLFLSWEEGYSI